MVLVLQRMSLQTSLHKPQGGRTPDDSHEGFRAAMCRCRRVILLFKCIAACCSVLRRKTCSGRQLTLVFS